MSDGSKAQDIRPGTAAFAREYLERLHGTLDAIDPEAVSSFIEALLSARDRGARIFFLGNGGSAATASHFANDIGFSCRSWLRPFRVTSLTDNSAVITAIANDFGYEEVFALQLKTALMPHDVVVAISVSGNSPNVVRAVEYANAVGAVTVGVTGFDGGRLRKIAHLSVHVPTRTGDYGPAEDAHMVIDHLVGAALIEVCRAETGERQ
jgi:D-sedoheptulose 7-phosphate isomerase